MRLVFIALVLVALVGCSRGPNLVGTWHSGLGGAATTYHFRPDGTFSLESLYDGYRTTVNGKYSVERGQLHLDPANSTVDGAGRRVEEIRSMVSQPSRVTIQMYSPDSFRVGLEDPPLVLNRMSRNP